MNEITQDLLKELFNYRDGKLYWKISRGNKKSGYLAGTVRPDEYRQIMINGKTYLAHRLIFLYHHGYLPKFLDHIDGNPSNNNISNLRGATFSQNQHNRKKGEFYKDKPTSSIYKGVSWHEYDSRWVSHIWIDGKLKRLGGFKSEIDAAKAYDKAASEAFGEFARVNIN